MAPHFCGRGPPSNRWQLPRFTCGRSDGFAQAAANATVLMSSFADVENVEPDLANRVRAILLSTTNAVLGTIRRDGSPRLSGADPYFHDGQLPHLVNAAGAKEGQGPGSRRQGRGSRRPVGYAEVA